MRSSPMSQAGVFFVILCLIFYARAQNSSESQAAGVLKPLRPSLAVILGIVSVLISLTFLILAYAKFCHSRNNHHQTFQGLIRSGSRFSGIDRKVIDSLPFFRFSSLKGSKEGLECSVCLSKFEDSEVLRLLPKCKHAFHKNCIDQWLESHSSCPLCRYKFNPEDLNSFTYSNSLRYSRSPSNLTQDPNIELFIQREQDDQGSSRFNIGSKDEGKAEELLIQECNADGNWKILHKFKHKIIISDVIVKNRWSDVNSSDLLSLKSEMISVMSSNRFSPSYAATLSMHENLDKIKEDMTRKRLYESKISSIDRSYSFSTSSDVCALQTHESSSKLMNHSTKRSMSEIVNFSRFRESSTKNRTKEYTSPRNSGREERIRKLWLPIARRTIQWFAGRQRTLHELEYRRQEHV